jgi:hypothetical protein
MRGGIRYDTCKAVPPELRSFPIGNPKGEGNPEYISEEYFFRSSQKWSDINF